MSANRIICVFLVLALHSAIYKCSHLSKLVMKSSSKVFPSNPGICVQDAKCEPIQNSTCFGTVLPYSTTSLALAQDSVSQLEIQDNLALWQGLRSVPRCWAVVQPLLCAIYMPKCENGTMSLPSQEMCRITRAPCKAIEAKHGWPMFLRCENKKIFPPGCRNPLQEVKFNTSFKCVPPLIETDNPDSWYENVDGCGLQCQNPLFTKEEHGKVQTFIKVMASICFSLNLFTILTFLISWKAANRYPAVIIFYINACLLVASFGWLIQFFPGARDEIVCLPDGTIRRKQPRSGEHLCSITFVLVYSFLMAALVWFVILAYAWHVLFKQSSSSKDLVKKKVPYFHLAAWCIPLVLTTIVMAMKEVDSDSVSGICFVGYANHSMRVGFLLVPVAAATVLGGFFLVSALYTLVRIKFNSQELANGHVKQQIHRMILKIGTFSVFSLILVLCTFACHSYDFTYRSLWEEDLRDYIICLAMFSTSTHPTCGLKNRPSVSMVQLHLLALFGFGIIMSSWVWTASTIETWRRFFYGLCEPPEKSALALKRHQLISKAFQHRLKINQGHMSFSMNSNHGDPVGMNLDVNSVASREISSTWAAALPQLLNRRNAVSGIGPIGVKHYSSASDVSARRISLDSLQQQNLDSLSLQMSEQEFAHVLRHQRRKTRKERERFLKANRIAPWFPNGRRGSDTSLQSSIIAASVAAAAAQAAASGKVTKSTSTGDLNNESILPLRPPSSSFVVNRPLIQRPVIPNLPFTHGMTDNSHCQNGQTSSGHQPEAGRYGNAAAAYSMASTSTSHSPFHNPYIQNFMGLVPPVPLAYLYNGLNRLIAGTGYAPAVPPNMPYNGFNVAPYPNYAQYQNALMNQCQQQPLLPLNPMADSASETEYLPIILSDSEFTDGSQMPIDEARFLSAQGVLRDQATPLIAPMTQFQFRPHSTRPTLEPQQCAKTQFLKKINSTSALTNKDLQSNQQQIFENAMPNLVGRTLSYSEVPPPSPEDSDASYEDEFETNAKSRSRHSLKSLANGFLGKMEKGLKSENNIFQIVKSKMKRSSSFSHDMAAVNPEDIELSLRTSSRLSMKQHNGVNDKCVQ